MSENQIRRTDDLSYCDTMTTEELEEILRLDAEMPEGQESDTEKILYIMEVLAERKRNTSHTGNTALEAFESFKQNYMPETDSDVIPIKKTNHGVPRWVRGLVATAAVLAILLASSITAEAFGFNVWKAVIQWTQETFHFGNWGNSDLTNNREYESLQEALEHGKITTPLAPTWVPSGYVLEDIKIEQTPLKKVYTAIYANGEQRLRLSVQDYMDESPIYIEQSEGLVEKYERSGVIYYILTDVNVMKASWITDSYECSIFGNVTIEDLKMMIDSIEKG